MTGALWPEEVEIVARPTDITVLDHLMATGFIGMLGWFSVFMVAVLAIFVICRQVTAGHRLDAQGWFFPIVHIASLVFLQTITVARFFGWPCCDDMVVKAATEVKYMFMYTATGLGLLLGSTVSVCLVTRTLPKPTTGSLLQLCLILLELLLLTVLIFNAPLMVG